MRSRPARRAAQFPRLAFSPTVLGIGGCSGSGKTTLANELARLLHGLRFHLDDYYLDLSHIRPEQRTEMNFDDPATIDVPLLAEHVGALARGDSIDRPCYDFVTHTRMAGRTVRVTSGPFLIVEGIFALYFPQLLPLYHLRVYVDTPDELCFARRLKRDQDERGRTEVSVRYQWEHRVRPSSETFVRPSAAHADLVIDGAGALDWKVERVIAETRKRGLLTGKE